MKRPLFILFIFCIIGFFCVAQPGALDLTFDPGTGAANNARILSLAIQNDGKILIGGEFLTFNGDTVHYLARLLTDGSIDTSFRTGTGPIWKVRTIAIQPDNKILIGGDFSVYNGTYASGIARVNADGSLDTTFHTGAGFNGNAHVIILQNDSRILVGGEFSSYNGISATHIVRLNTDGSIDSSFNSFTGASSTVEAIAIQPDSNIVIGGDFTSYGPDIRVRVARLYYDGTDDSTFNPMGGAGAVVFDMAIQPDKRIILVGNFPTYGFQPRPKIARIETDASLNNFNIGQPGANSNINRIKLFNNGKVLIAGNYTNFDGMNVNRIAMLDMQGALDTTFNSGSGADNEINAMAVQQDGKIIIAGAFGAYNGIARSTIARLYNCTTPQPGPITGSDSTFCSDTLMYSIAPVQGAGVYQWTLPQGWTGSSDSASIIVVSNGQGGVISVMAFSDSCGFSVPQTKIINRIQVPAISICLVTVDSQSTHNIVIWEKPVTALIDSFLIYREITTNNYGKVASIPFDSLSEYHDYGANPNVTSYRYKLSTLDKCGNESAQSLYHNTIHLQNLGFGNFQWTFYQIENSLNPVLSFNVYRDNLGNGNFFPIGNVPGSNATFTDITYSSFPNSIYVVDVNWSISCNPTRAVSTTRSNIRHLAFVDTIGSFNNLESVTPDMLKIYPNPANKLVIISVPFSLSITGLKLFNTLGQLVWTEANEIQGRSFRQLDLENFTPGFYTISVATSVGELKQKLIIQKTE